MNGRVDAPGSWRRFLPDGNTRLLGILGDPITHSLSPALHTAVLRRLARNLIYVPFPVTADRLGAFLREAPGFGVLGVNVTTPFKEAAAGHVRPGDRETERTEMVNTIHFREGAAIGYGTDGAGILGWMDECGLGGGFGLLGFGATARSLAVRALSEGRHLARILTRRPEEVRARLGALSPPPAVMPRVAGWEEIAAIEGALPDVWISTLPSRGWMPPEAFWERCSRRSVLLDMNYGPGRTDLCLRARSLGIRAADGLGPLCHQAALSLSLWLGDEVSPALFRRALGASERSLRPGR